MFCVLFANESSPLEHYAFFLLLLYFLNLAYATCSPNAFIRDRYLVSCHRSHNENLSPVHQLHRTHEKTTMCVCQNDVDYTYHLLWVAFLILEFNLGRSLSSLMLYFQPPRRDPRSCSLLSERTRHSWLRGHSLWDVGSILCKVGALSIRDEINSSN